MSSNISDPYQKKSDNPSITVRKTSGDLDETKKALVTSTDIFGREGNTDMVYQKKPNVVKEAITPPISSKNNIDTFNKTEKSPESNKTVDTPRSNKTDKFKSLDESRSTQITYT